MRVWFLTSRFFRLSIKIKENTNIENLLFLLEICWFGPQDLRKHKHWEFVFSPWDLSDSSSRFTKTQILKACFFTLRFVELNHKIQENTNCEFINTMRLSSMLNLEMLVHEYSTCNTTFYSCIIYLVSIGDSFFLKKVMCSTF